MMKKINKSFWILPVLVVLVTACTTTKAEKMDEASESVQNAQKDLDQANKQYAKEVEAYRASVESDLRNNKLKIAQLQDQKAGSKEETLVVRNEKIRAIRKSNDELELRMRQYKGDNKENWAEFQREFDSDMMQLGKSLRDIGKDNVE